MVIIEWLSEIQKDSKSSLSRLFKYTGGFNKLIIKKVLDELENKIWN